MLEKEKSGDPPTTDLETQRRSRELPERVKILRRIREQEEERAERKRKNERGERWYCSYISK